MMTASLLLLQPFPYFSESFPVFFKFVGSVGADTFPAFSAVLHVFFEKLTLALLLLHLEH